MIENNYRRANHSDELGTKLHTTNLLRGTREAGLQRLQAFIPNAGRAYQTTRNLDYGAGEHSNVSMLSPYIRHRLVREEEILKAVLKHHSETEAFKFIQEVFWRSYWKGWLEHHGMLWTEYQQLLKPSLTKLENSKYQRRAYHQAVAGETQIGPFNDWVKELLGTGYLHNHARMWFASVWIFTFKLPWELGADFFFRHLIDGDAASNTLAWRWVAGLHTKNKTYLATAANIRKCSEQRFGEPCDSALGLKHLSTTAQPQAENLSAGALQKTAIVWPRPLNDEQQENIQSGLLLTEEDLSTHLPVKGLPTAGLSPTPRSPIGTTSPLVSVFSSNAIRDALNRLDSEGSETVAPDIMEDEELVSWVVEQNIQLLFHAYVPSGPTQLRLKKLSPKLASKGVTLVPFMSDYDRLVWPHADRGFFQLGKQIPRFLAVMELGQKASKDISVFG